MDPQLPRSRETTKKKKMDGYYVMEMEMRTTIAMLNILLSLLIYTSSFLKELMNKNLHLTRK